MNNSNWHIEDFDLKRVKQIAEEFSLPQSIAKIMSFRGKVVKMTTFAWKVVKMTSFSRKGRQMTTTFSRTNRKNYVFFAATWNLKDCPAGFLNCS